MKDEQAAFVADALLSLCDPSPERPYYTDGKMRQKLFVSERRDPIYAHLMGNRPHDSLLEDECRDIVESAKLTDRQTDVLGLRMEGLTFEEIGRRRGHTRQGAMKIFVQALKKLARAFRVYPYRGMSDVYRSEIRRGSSKIRSGTIATRDACRAKGGNHGQLSAMSSSQ